MTEFSPDSILSVYASVPRTVYAHWVKCDLKPSNIKITIGGLVKVLDFELARVFTTDTSSACLARAPTLLKGTEVGVILGTAACMSRERATVK